MLTRVRPIQLRPSTSQDGSQEIRVLRPEGPAVVQDHPRDLHVAHRLERRLPHLRHRRSDFSNLCNNKYINKIHVKS